MSKRTENKEVEKMQEIGVTLRIPPGDFRKVKIDNDLQIKLSHDLAEFMNATKGQPAKFYILVKFYLSERKGLHKMMKSNSKGKLAIIEASMNATVVSLMTIAVAGQMDNIMEGGDFKSNKNLQGCIKELRDALKSKQRMLDFDRFCNNRFGVSEVVVDREYWENKDGEEFSVDSHLKAES